jgi:cytochrome P450
VTSAPGGGLEGLLGSVDVADPYPLWQSLLDAGPVVSPDGAFALLSSHADCDDLLRSGALSSDRRNSTRWQEMEATLSDDDREWLGRARSFLFMDAPDHTRLRRLVSKAFTPRTVEALQPLVQKLSRDLLDAAYARGRLELVGDLAYPLPVRVISHMLGVPAEDHVRFAGWSAALASGLDTMLSAADPDSLRERRRAVEQFRAYFRDLAEQRRRDPEADLLSALVAAEDAGDRLSSDELVSTAMLLLVAGHETTVSLIANGALALLRDPELRSRLAADAELAPGVVDEVLRLDPPVQMTLRIALDDVEVPGGVVRKGGAVVLLLAAAGRDPRQHDDPLRLDPGRTTGHLAFSAGAHYCLGAPLARLEARVVLHDLARRLVEPRLEAVTYRENRVLRGPARMQVSYAALREDRFRGGP